jgi:hypothetical protein
MDQKQTIAVEIALQTQVLKTCPVHARIYVDDESDMDRAFSLAVELVRQREPCVQPFHDDPHGLTDLLSTAIGTSPASCPDCQSGRQSVREPGARAGEHNAGDHNAGERNAGERNAGERDVPMAAPRCISARSSVVYAFR